MRLWPSASLTGLRHAPWRRPLLGTGAAQVQKRCLKIEFKLVLCRRGTVVRQTAALNTLPRLPLCDACEPSTLLFDICHARKGATRHYNCRVAFTEYCPDIHAARSWTPPACLATYFSTYSAVQSIFLVAYGLHQHPLTAFKPPTPAIGSTMWHIVPTTQPPKSVSDLDSPAKEAIRSVTYHPSPSSSSLHLCSPCALSHVVQVTAGQSIAPRSNTPSLPIGPNSPRKPSKISENLASNFSCDR